jgi:hypothetical protein
MGTCGIEGYLKGDVANVSNHELWTSTVIKGGVTPGNQAEVNGDHELLAHVSGEVSIDDSDPIAVVFPEQEVTIGGQPIAVTFDLPVQVTASEPIQTQAPPCYPTEQRGYDITDEGHSIVEATAGRVFLEITNNDASHSVYVAIHDDPSADDRRLGPGQSMTFAPGFTGAVYGIAATGETVRVGAHEYTNEAP